jgi:uncharacterized protein YacL
MQTKKYSFLESIVNTTVGFVIALLMQIIVYPIMNIPVTLNQNIILTFLFTILSIARGYVIRRWFNLSKNKKQSIINK